MPPRTNAFQRLAAIMHSDLGEGWKVQESAMLRDSITGQMREVDVVATGIVGSYGVCISVECRDHKRMADVTWIESMAKKHESLPTSKLALWSRSGFTKSAVAKAHALNIVTVSQANVRSTHWTKIARDLVGGFVQLLTPRFSPFIDVTLPDGTLSRLENIADAMIYDSSGNIVYSILAILEFMSTNEELRSAMHDHAPIGSGNFYGEVLPPTPWFVSSAGGNRAKVIRVGIVVSTQTERAPLETASAEMEGKVATLIAAKTTVGHFQIYAEDGAGGVKVASVILQPSSAK